MNKLVVFGDLHSRPKEPFLSSVKKVIEWFLSSEWNNKDNIFLNLGDLTEDSINKGYVNEILIDFFEKLKCEHKYILQGNHDTSFLHGSNLRVLEHIEGVEIIDTHKTMQFGKHNCLMLPYQLPSDNGTIEEMYSSLKDDSEYGFCFAHIMDETRKFSKDSKVCDLSNLKIKQRIFGHDHTYDLDKKGSYLGSVQPNSKTEIDKTPYIYIIDLEGDDHKAVPVPRFINYYDVAYPDKLPVLTDDYNIIRITESLDRDDSIKKYKDEVEAQGKDFILLRCERKRYTEEITDEDIDKDNKGLTNKQYFNSFSKLKKLTPLVESIISKVLD